MLSRLSSAAGASHMTFSVFVSVRRTSLINISCGLAYGFARGEVFLV